MERLSVEGAADGTRPASTGASAAEGDKENHYPLPLPPHGSHPTAFPLANAGQSPAKRPKMQHPFGPGTSASLHAPAGHGTGTVGYQALAGAYQLEPLLPAGDTGARGQCFIIKVTAAAGSELLRSQGAGLKSGTVYRMEPGGHARVVEGKMTKDGQTKMMTLLGGGKGK